MAFEDLREYINRLKEEGELLEIEEEVDWNLEVGAIVRRVNDLGAPAPLFKRIKGYPEGYRILGAMVGASSKPDRYFARVALSLGMEPDLSATDIVEEYLKRTDNPIKPILVSNGPCKENIHVGDKVDLFEFPAPLIHEGDGGRYIGTWPIVITRDPDTGWVNWGTYRLMIHDKRTLGILLVPSQHIGMMYYPKYEARNKPMEVAIAMGTEPTSTLMAGNLDIPAEVNEADIAGAIRREPIKLVKCEMVDLEVPASSETVLEGEILPLERKEEGPFGEQLGYRVGERSPKPVIHIKAVTHRNNPILPMVSTGVPPDDGHPFISISQAAQLLRALRERKYPVKTVYSPPHAVCSLIIISTKIPYFGFAKEIAMVTWGLKGARVISFLVVVDEDIDPTDLNQVMWALTTRCHPDKGIWKLTDTPALPNFIPFLGPHDRGHGIGAKVLFDCTFPKDWPGDFIPLKASFDRIWPKEIQEKVLSKWKKYGY